MKAVPIEQLSMYTQKIILGNPINFFARIHSLNYYFINHFLIYRQRKS